MSCETSVKEANGSTGTISQPSRTNKEIDGSGFKKRQHPVMEDGRHIVSAQ